MHCYGDSNKQQDFAEIHSVCIHVIILRLNSDSIFCSRFVNWHIYYWIIIIWWNMNHTCINECWKKITPSTKQNSDFLFFERMRKKNVWSSYQHIISIQWLLHTFVFFFFSLLNRNSSYHMLHSTVPQQAFISLSTFYGWHVNEKEKTCKKNLSNGNINRFQL